MAKNDTKLTKSTKTGKTLPTFTQGELSDADTAKGKSASFNRAMFNQGRQTTTYFAQSAHENQPNNGFDKAFFAKAKDDRPYNDAGK